MKAYQLAMGIIVFNLALPLARAAGVLVPTAHPVSPPPSTAADLMGKMVSVTGILAGVASVILRFNLGAGLFALIFGVTSIPAQATLNAIVAPYMVGSAAAVIAAAVTLIYTTLLFVFAYAFIQLSGVPTGD